MSDSLFKCIKFKKKLSNYPVNIIELADTNEDVVCALGMLCFKFEDVSENAFISIRHANQIC